MKQHLFKTLRWLGLALIVAMAGPSLYVLGKMDFDRPSHAENSTASSAHSNTTTQPTSLPMARFSYADAVAKAAPAVVSIKTTKEVNLEMHPLMQDPFFRQFFGGAPNAFEQPPQEQQGLGSGVLVDQDGHILTNNHVIKGADTVTVTLQDGRSGEAKVIGTDPETDLAVLKVDLKNLPFITLGSSSHLRPGDIVLAIGNPFGFDQTVTQGIVSATERPGSELGNLSNLIQTDAAINPGNSGGALIDLDGHLVAINTAIYSRSGGYQGIGFAIPIDQASLIMDQLLTGKKISRGWLGVVLQNLNADIKTQLKYEDNIGVYIRALTQGSPAQKAGLLPGDIIRKINNVEVKDVSKTTALVTSLKAGDNYPVEIYREGDIMTFTIQLGERKILPDHKLKKK